jgi:hypothetical protein
MFLVLRCSFLWGWSPFHSGSLGILPGAVLVLMSLPVPFTTLGEAGGQGSNHSPSPFPLPHQMASIHQVQAAWPVPWVRWGQASP